MFYQYLYPKSPFEAGRCLKWSLARLYLPFWAEKFFEMAFSLDLLENKAGFEDYFTNICILKTTLKQEAVQNGL
jgi:hypothetical protein